MKTFLPGAAPASFFWEARGFFFALFLPHDGNGRMGIAPYNLDRSIAVDTTVFGICNYMITFY